MRTALAAICVFTLLATSFLTASLMILRPPRANYQQWTCVATLIILQGALTLFALRAGGPTRLRQGYEALRYLAAAGALAMMWVGASAVYSTMSGPHVEGYALVLGSAMVVQGLLTLAMFLVPGTVPGAFTRARVP